MSHELYRMDSFGEGVEDEGNAVNCPWCGEHLEGDLSSDFTGDEEESDCYECNKPVIIRKEVFYSFTAFKAHQVRDIGRERTRQILAVDAIEKFLIRAYNQPYRCRRCSRPCSPSQIFCSQTCELNAVAATFGFH